MTSDDKIIDEEIQKLNNGINNVVDEVIDDITDKPPAEKKKIKMNVIFMLNLIIILISYMNCCKKNNITEPAINNISISKNL